jgi:hypothetical protein
MSQREYERDRPRPHGGPGAVVGASVALLLIQGVLSILEGVSALADDRVYVVVHHYAFKFDLTVWGWIQVVLGAVLFVAGLGMLSGALWARVAGLMLVSFNVIASFMFLPYQPLWSIVQLGIGVFLVWSLCTTATDDMQ